MCIDAFLAYCITLDTRGGFAHQFFEYGITMFEVMLADVVDTNPSIWH